MTIKTFWKIVSDANVQVATKAVQIEDYLVKALRDLPKSEVVDFNEHAIAL